MKFCANVSILFKDAPFLERFERAAAAGFPAVELWWPAGERLDEIEDAVARAGLGVALINFDAGDMPAGDRGLLADPDRAHAFRENVPVALDLARRIGCERMNALVGLERSPGERDAQLTLAAENVHSAADQAAPHGIDITIEAVDTFENSPYLVHTTRQAAAFIDTVDRPNVRIQWDAYHMQRMEGNLVATFAGASRLNGQQFATWRPSLPASAWRWPGSDESTRSPRRWTAAGKRPVADRLPKWTTKRVINKLRSAAYMSLSRLGR